jgi:hypothetical protein
MNIGMLWFDNDPKADLNAKIERAVQYYQNKYGQAPNLCYVHPTMVKNGSSKYDNVEIKTNKSVLPNHLWLGINQHTNQVSG